MLAPPSALAVPPSVVGVDFDAAPEVGKSSVVAIRATDPKQALTGLTVDFGDGEDDFAETACRIRPRATAAVLPAGTQEFRIRHRYASSQPRAVTVRVFTGTCTTPGETATYTFRVTPWGVLKPIAPLKVDGIGGARIARRVETCGADAHLVPDLGNLARIQVATECLVSAARTSRGVPAVKSAEGLRKAGLIQVYDMLKHKYFAHEREGGPDLYARLNTAGYDFELAGENLGAGTGQYATAAEIVEQWLASPPHRDNMLDRSFTEIGLGISTGFPMGGGSPNGATYALEFGAPAVALTAEQIAARKAAAAAKKRALRKKCKKKAYRRKHARACRAALK